MLDIEKLKKFGADTDDGLARCMNMESFYLDLVSTVLDGSQLDELEASLAANDLSKAFEAAHALKGVYSNLSLTPLSKPISTMTELLRSKTETDYSELMNTVKLRYKQLCELAK